MSPISPQPDSILKDPLLSRLRVISGYKVLGPCVLRRLIGQGGMGGVYYAQHLNLGIDVAVKCLLANAVNLGPEMVSRFRREAVLAATISHPSLVRVFDVGEEEGLYYLVMEYVKGETLRERVTRKGRLQLREALTIIIAAAGGLGAAHRASVVHRDIKPDNIMVSCHGEVKVADLGLAKSGAALDSLATSSCLVMGTPPYMPPEQFESSASVEASADVYSLGLTLVYLLSGSDLFQGSLSEIMAQICIREFPDLERLKLGIPEDLMRVIADATAKDPAGRPVDALALREQLKHVLDDHGGPVSLLESEYSRVEAPKTLVSPLPQRLLSEIKRQQEMRVGSDGAVPVTGVVSEAHLGRPAVVRRSLTIAILLGVILVAVLGFAVQQTRDGSVGGGDDLSLRAILERLQDPATRDQSIEELVVRAESHADDEEVHSHLVHALRERAEDLESSGLVSDALYYGKRALAFARTESHARLVQRIEASVRREIENGFVLDPQEARQTSDRAISIRGRASFSGIKLVEAEGVQVTPESGQFVLPLPVEEGSQTLSVRATDRNGISVVRSLSVLVDRTAPVILVENPDEGALTPALVKVRVHVQDASDVTLSVPSSQALRVAPSAAPVEVELRLEHGDQSIHIKAVDALGQATLLQRRVRVDAEPPELRLAEAESRMVTKEERVEIVGCVRDDGGAQVYLSGQEIPLPQDEDGGFVAAIALPQEGDQEVELRAVDRAGNVTTARRVIRRDVTGPTFTFSNLPADGRIPPGEFVLRGSIADRSGVAAVTIRGEAVEWKDGVFSYALNLPKPGLRRLELRAVDILGNESMRALSLYVMRECVPCAKSGECAPCNGSGFREAVCTACTGHGVLPAVPCGVCERRGMAKCGDCRGSGHLTSLCSHCTKGRKPCSVPHEALKILGIQCPDCNGENTVACNKCDGHGNTITDCIPCQGGYLPGHPCPHCQQGWNVHRCPEPRCVSGKIPSVRCRTCEASGRCKPCDGVGYVQD